MAALNTNKWHGWPGRTEWVYDSHQQAITLLVFDLYSPLVLDCLQPSTSGLVQLLPVWEECQSTGDDQHPQPGDDAPRRPVHGWWRYIQTLSWDSQWAIIQLCSNLSISAAEVVVSNLRRIRIRSNSTGAKHSSPKEPTGPRRFGNQLETPDKQRLSCGGKVPKSASISSLSLIITPGCQVTTTKTMKEQRLMISKLFCILFQMRAPAASSPVPSPLAPSPPTLHHVTPPPTETCHCFPAAWSPPSSSKSQGRNLASPCRRSESTWVKVTSIRCITW